MLKLLRQFSQLPMRFLTADIAEKEPHLYCQDLKVRRKLKRKSLSVLLPICIHAMRLRKKCLRRVENVRDKVISFLSLNTTPVSVIRSSNQKSYTALGKEAYEGFGNCCL